MYEDYEDYEDYKEDKQDEIYLLKRKMQERRLPEENILDFFPYEKYPIRDAQRTAIQGIEKALAEGKKYIFIQGPTGFGKSALAYTLLRYFGEGYVCTSSIALQEQYLRDFNTLLKVKGRGNFQCKERINKKTGFPYSCAEGACEVLQQPCRRKPTSRETQYIAYMSCKEDSVRYWQERKDIIERCEYWVQKAEALNNFATIHNYPYLLHEANYVGEFCRKEVLISDEGHNVESALIDFIKLPVSQDDLDILNKFLDVQSKFFFQKTNVKMANVDKLNIHAEWLKGLIEAFPTAISRIQAESSILMDEQKELEHQIPLIKDEYLKHKAGDRLEILDKRINDLYKDMKSLDNKKNTINFFLTDITKSLDNWVVYEDFETTGETKKIEFQPVRVSKYAYDNYLRLGKINVIMSATILDHSRIASDLGIDLRETAYIEIDPLFPAENHKVFNLGIADFSFIKGETKEEKDTFHKQVVARIDQILDIFPEDRGIIHCTTYEIMYAVKNFSRHQERLTTHKTRDRMQKLEEHKIKKGSVLVSPSFTEGIDLKDDLSRFQILVKVPKPNTQDERIKKRAIVDPPSYDFMTAKTIIQSAGRSVRSEKDRCVTFTMDNRFTSFCRKNYKSMKLFTRHFRPNTEMREICSTDKIRELLKPISRGKQKQLTSFPDQKIKRH